MPRKSELWLTISHCAAHGMNGISLHRVEELNALTHPECVVAGSLTSNTATHAPTHLGQYAQDRGLLSLDTQILAVPKNAQIW